MALPYIGHLNNVFTGANNTFIGANAGTNVKEDAIVNCSACKLPYDSTTTYLIYHGTKIQRNICHKCQVKAMDKMYGVDINVDLEDVLFEQK